MECLDARRISLATLVLVLAATSSRFHSNVRLSGFESAIFRFDRLWVYQLHHRDPDHRGEADSPVGNEPRTSILGHTQREGRVGVLEAYMVLRALAAHAQTLHPPGATNT